MLFSFDLDETDNQTQRVVLDNKSYELRFQWNYTMETWTVFLGGVGQPPYCSFNLTTYNNLTEPYKYLEGMPQGSFVAGGYISTSARIGRYNVGPAKECFFIYLSNVD